MEQQREASGLVTPYSTPIIGKRLDDGRLAEYLLAKGGNYHVRLDGGPWRDTGIGEGRDARLHRTGRLYFTQGQQLRSVSVDGGAQQVVANLPDTATIGGGEGDFDPTERYAPLRVGSSAGVIDLETGKFWLHDMGRSIDHVHVADADTVVVRAGGVYRVSRDGTTSQWFDKGGHADMAVIDGRPVYVTVSDDMTAGDYQRWGLGPYQTVPWLLAIDVHTGELVYKRDKRRDGRWTANHIGCIGSLCALSHDYLGESSIEVFDLADGRQVVDRHNTGAVVDEYYEESQPAWGELEEQADGNLARKLYFAVNLNTDSIMVPVDGAADDDTPPPESEPEPEPQPEPEKPMSDYDNRLAHLRSLEAAGTIANLTTQAPVVPSEGQAGTIEYDEKDGDHVMENFNPDGTDQGDIDTE